jgi:hypothetical protein
MECGNCRNRFTRNLYTPLILPRCGHTICKVCFRSCKKYEVICEICDYIKTNDENELPTNQALLEILPIDSECKRHDKMY